MSSVRVLFAEVDGSDETVRSVLNQLADRVQSARSVPAVIDKPALPPPAPLVEELPAAPVLEPHRGLTLRSPELQRPVKRHKNGNRFAPSKRAAKKSAAEPAFSFQREKSETPGTISDAIRAAVREGPKTNGGVLRYVQTHGHPEVNSSTISTILSQRRNANEMYKDDQTLEWHMAEKRQPH